jgi:hypothetical protein
MTVKKKSIRLRISNPGLKVKVYNSRREDPPRFGETIGIDDRGVILLAPRNDFAKLPLHHFNYILHANDVRFITDAELSGIPIRKASGWLKR